MNKGSTFVLVSFNLCDVLPLFDVLSSGADGEDHISHVLLTFIAACHRRVLLY